MLSRVPEAGGSWPPGWSRRSARCARLICKKPSIAETIDWTKTALALGAPEFDDAVVRSTLGVVLKHVADQDRAAERLGLT